MIPLNKPYLPSFDKYQGYLQRMYDNAWLTNNGPLVQEFKSRLEEYLGVTHLLPVVNGTMALQLAYKILNVQGKAVTTPYSFVATSSSLEWLGIKPQFADIDPQSLNLCPEQACVAIDKETTAIVPVHIYGNPCDVEAFDRLGQDYDLKVIYDAAQGFGVKVEERSLLSFGDASIVSFHATKLFHAIEGGAVIFNNAEDYQRAAETINFGIDHRNGEITGTGINGKMSEAHAAMGLAVLDDADLILERRQRQFDLYQHLLQGKVQFPLWHQHANHNGAYLPIILASDSACAHIQAVLKSKDIQTRRYFSSPLSQIEYLANGVNQSLASTEDLAGRILCLPLFFELTDTEIQTVCQAIIDNL